VCVVVVVVSYCLEQDRYTGDRGLDCRETLSGGVL
jgi:hypothetical protein